jgi:hypothetical protein
MAFHNKQFKFKRIAFICETELSNDVVDDLAGNELTEYANFINCKGNLYDVKSTRTAGKDINETTKLRMNNLNKQLKGFDYLIIDPE